MAGHRDQGRVRDSGGLAPDTDGAGRWAWTPDVGWGLSFVLASMDVVGFVDPTPFPRVSVVPGWRG